MGFPFVGGVRLNLGGVTPLHELDIGISAPANATAQDQVVVARAVPFHSSVAWTVDERAHFENGQYVTASPPFTGVVAGGSYAFLKSAGGCVSYVTSGASST